METLVPEGIGVFIGLTVILFGFAAFMTGQALADTWRPAWQMVAYGFLLALGNRFLGFFLFEVDLLSPVGLLVDAVVVILIGLFAWRVTHARRMVQQYPWLYRADGLFGYREI
jgi:hypothetical protein